MDNLGMCAFCRCFRPYAAMVLQAIRFASRDRLGQLSEMATSYFAGLCCAGHILMFMQPMQAQLGLYESSDRD